MDKAFYDILIVGGSAAGLLAAIKAKEENPSLRVAVLDKNMEPAKKLYATGNGRCNFLNINACSHDYYSCGMPDAVPAVVDFVLKQGRISEILHQFSALGIESIGEEDGRLYPRSMQAKSIVDALVNGAIRRGVEIFCNYNVTSIKHRKNYSVFGQDGTELDSKNLILATGGKAGIQYGCTGDGFKLASSLGHNVIKPIPALTQLLANDDLSDLGGVRAKARISFISSREGAETILAEDSGEVQFNKDSLSGICTFNVSRFYQIKDGVKYIAELDLMEEYSEEEFAALLKFRQQNLVGAYAFDLLSGLIPEKLVFYILKKAEVDPMCIITEVKGQSFQRIIEITKSLRFAIVGTKSWKDAQVTAGGVDVSEVNAETLESTKSKCLFFAGEILDVDGPCGGYNLTWAFASGMIAGSAAAKKCKKID